MFKKQSKDVSRPGYACPSCRSNDWKAVKDTVSFDYYTCGSCGDSPRLPEATRGPAELKAMSESVYREEELAQAAHQAQLALHKNLPRPNIVQLADLRKTKDLAEQAKKKAELLTLVNSIHDLFPEGYITLHIPPLGFGATFMWGKYLSSLDELLRQSPKTK